MLLLLAGAAHAAWPLTGTDEPDVVQDAFGPRLLRGDYDVHRGMDFAGHRGEPVYAVRAGTVVRTETADEDAGTELERFGNFVLVELAPLPDGTPLHAAYLHLQSVDVAVGDVLAEGQALGRVDSSGEGIVTEHLHLNVYEGLEEAYIDDARTVCPMRVLPDPGLDEVVLEKTAARTVRFGAAVPEADLVRLDVAGPFGARRLDFEANDLVDLASGRVICDDLQDDCPGVDIDPVDYEIGDAEVVWDVTFHGIGAIGGACLDDVDGQVAAFGEGCGPGDACGCAAADAPGAGAALLAMALVARKRR
jgi:MYXO-CTERM domain-containing protein